MNSLVLLLMTSCPVGIDAAPSREAQPNYAQEGNGNGAEPGSNGRQSFMTRFRGWFHRSSHGNDNNNGNGNGTPPSGDANRYPPGYGQRPYPASPQPFNFAGGVPMPVRFPTTAEPPLADPLPPGK